MNQPRNIVPPLLESALTNQQILAALAEGTGGFTIFNTNDILGGLQRIAREQDEYYVMGYVPAESPEGSCHTLKVKLEHGGGMNVRSRSGYCNSRPKDLLAGRPIEKELENRAAATEAGSIQGTMQAPYFFTAANTARVNVALDLPFDSLKFEKEKGKYRSTMNVLGIAYKSDGSIGARFSDTVDLTLEKDELKQFAKTPYHYQNQFEAAPGSYKLTVVFSAGGESFGRFEAPLTIDSYDGKHMSLSGIALSTQMQRVQDVPAGLDAELLEDRKPLVTRGLQFTPSANLRFQKTEEVALYAEIYDPQEVSENPPAVLFAYRILEGATNKEVMNSGRIDAGPYLQKGNPVIPVALKVPVKDLNPGVYKLVLLAGDAAGNMAPQRMLEFGVQ